MIHTILFIEEMQEELMGSANQWTSLSQKGHQDSRRSIIGFLGAIASKHVRKCYHCQIYSSNYNAPPPYLHYLVGLQNSRVVRELFRLELVNGLSSNIGLFMNKLKLKFVQFGS